jgi:hypothetical protein
MRVELDEQNTEKLIAATRPTGHSVNAIVNKVIGQMDFATICESIINMIRDEQKKMMEQQQPKVKK